MIRKDIAKYIADRDNHPCDHNNVFLCTGASDGIKVGKTSSISFLPLLCVPTESTGA